MPSARSDFNCLNFMVILPGLILILKIAHFYSKRALISQKSTNASNLLKMAIRVLPRVRINGVEPHAHCRTSCEFTRVSERTLYSWEASRAQIMQGDGSPARL